MRNPVAEIDTELIHHLNHLRMDPLTGSGAGRAGAVAVLGGAFEERLAHLRAARVVEADEERVCHLDRYSARVERGTPITLSRRSRPPIAKSRMSSALAPRASQSVPSRS